MGKEGQRKRKKASSSGDKVCCTPNKETERPDQISIQRQHGDPTKSSEGSDVNSISTGVHGISNDNSNTQNTQHKVTSIPGGPSGDANDILVSEILSQTNSVLYNCDDTGDCVFVLYSVTAKSDITSGSDKSCVTSRAVLDISYSLIRSYM